MEQIFDRQTGLADTTSDLFDAADQKPIDPHWLEVGHRVGSSLQIVASLAGRAEVALRKELTAEAAIEAFRTVRVRVAAIAAIQRLLYTTEPRPGGTRPLLISIMSNLQTIYDRPSIQLCLGATATVPFARLHDVSLILCELMANALRHAYDHGDTGTVSVEVKMMDCGALHLMVADDGKGCTHELKFKAERGLGLVADLVSNTDGRFEKVPQVHGTTWLVRLPPKQRHFCTNLKLSAQVQAT